MLFIIYTIVLFILVVFAVRKGKYSWHGVLCVYFLSLPVIDIPEITFNTLFSLYQILPHFFSDLDKDLELGIIFSDALILPLTGVLFCHYASRTQHHWRLAFVFTSIHYILERIFLSLGYLQYVKWNIWISMTIFLAGFRFLAHYANRLLRYDPPIPYAIRIAVVTYSINAGIGAIIEGPLIGLYKWNLHIFETSGANERFADLGLGVIFAVLLALIIPIIQLRHKRIAFMSFAVIAILFSYFAYFKGWLIYSHWNHLFTALRWFFLFAAIAVYDRLETAYVQRLGNNSPQSAGK